MKNILRVDSSLFLEQGVSSGLMDELVGYLQGKYEKNRLVRRDLAAEMIPHLNGEWIQALMADEKERDQDQKNKVEYSDKIVAELEEANIIVLALPMYNFSVPSVVKAWFDHIARAGRTFKYTSDGPEGLLTNKKVYLVTTRGGLHKGKDSDTQIPFVLNFLKFVGLDDVEIIYAEGLNMGGDFRQQGIEEARTSIRSIMSA